MQCNWCGYLCVPYSLSEMGAQSAPNGVVCQIRVCFFEPRKFARRHNKSHIHCNSSKIKVHPYAFLTSVGNPLLPSASQLCLTQTSAILISTFPAILFPGVANSVCAARTPSTVKGKVFSILILNNPVLSALVSSTK